MPPDEREDFEEHYFTCSECAQDVRAAARFRANAREVLRNPDQFSEPERERPTALWRWPTLVPLAAVFALLAVVGYQNAITIPALREPQFPSTLTLDGPTRGPLRHIDEGQPVDLQMPIDEPAEGQKVIAELFSESGRVSRSLPTEPERGKPFRVLFPGRFPRGRYTIYVREDPSGKELFQDHFEIAPKETNAK
jgi:hypothetical protein